MTTPIPTTPSASDPAAARPQIPLLLGAVFLAYLGQQTLNPIIAPLSREVGLAEWQIGVTISTAAVMVVLTSQFWGRRSQSWGRKPVLVAAFALTCITMILFAALAWMGMTGALTGAALFASFVLLRGVAFGTAIAAVPPTAQAYIADVTTDETARVKGMSGVGAVQGIAMVGGAVLGGVLSAFGLMAPLIAVPVLLAAGLALLALRLRREPRHELIETPARVSPFDTRVWPFLVAGFGMFTALGFVQVITGFLVQDRLGLDASSTGLVTGGALLTAGLGMIVAQGVVVPRSGWAPATLLRVGVTTALAGFLTLIMRGRPGPTVRRRPAHWPRPGHRDARLHGGHQPVGQPRGAGRPGRVDRRDQRTDLRDRPHRGHRALRPLVAFADHRGCNPDGRRRGVRLHPRPIPADARRLRPSAGFASRRTPHAAWASGRWHHASGRALRRRQPGASARPRP
ncbi:MAG: MFS transporter [Propioniciclava sp.]|uniref:MFS transporter n=1 Tax=Propioniciclava sp. TaxID=2038686 RepID=UPI0039E4023E